MTAVSMSIYGDGLNNQTALGLLYLQTHTIYHMSHSGIQSQQRVNVKTEFAFSCATGCKQN